MRLPFPSVRLAPSRRSVAIGFGILALAGGAYALARETSLFSIQRIEVRGASPRLAAQVRTVLAPVAGSSLVGLDGGTVLQKVDSLPAVVRATYDRAFPHTLRITVVPERPAAVLRRGPDTWLVSVRGRVIGPLSSHADPKLPRVWLSARTPVRPGEVLTRTNGGAAARAAGRAGGFAARVAAISYASGALLFHLRSGLSLLLGAPSGIALKVAVAQRALATVPAGTTFLDVSVPGRLVSGTGVVPQIPVPGSSRG